MSQNTQAQDFSSLHLPGRPLVLYNAWDASSAKAVAKAGATALATSSWSMARTQGYDDGENIPLEFALSLLGRITASNTLPVTHDFEAGYASDLATLATNTERVIAAGAVGVNFEDGLPGGAGLQSVSSQTARISAMRRAAEATGVPLFINARTDVFFQGSKPGDHPALMDDAKARLRAYAEAGADGIFLPGLITPDLIAEICVASPLPVNIMQIGKAPDTPTLASLGVARISYGPAPFLSASAALTEAAKSAFGG